MVSSLYAAHNMSLQNEVKTLFSHFGRSGIEAETYLATLALGSGSAAEIAKRVGESRTKVYFHIKKLAEAGLLKESRKGKRQIFVPLPPKELAGIVTTWATNLRSLVPQLESIQKAAAETPIIDVSESRTGYARVYDDICALPQGSFFRVMQGRASLEDELRILDEQALHQFFAALITRDITTKGVFTKECLEVPKQLMSERNYAGMRKRKSNLSLLPESVLRVQQVMFIYQNTVAFLFPETALVMTVSHQGIADVLAAAFDALHSFGEKVAPMW